VQLSSIANLSKVMVFSLALAMLRSTAFAADSVSDYLRDGWDVKAVSQVSSVGYTQIVLQKGTPGTFL
jgi:hypothetical protein